MAISELQKQLSTLLVKLRIRHGLSKFKMATLAEVSDHTWDRYENGESSPTLPEFINIYNELGEDALRDIISIMYPDKYNGLVSTDETLPDVELFRIGLNLGKKATMEKKESYSLTKKDED